MRPAHSRDDAKAAWMIAAFGDLHVSKMFRRQAKAWRGEIRNVLGVKVDLDERSGGWSVRLESGVRESSGFRFAEFLCAANSFSVLMRSRGSISIKFGKAT